MPFPPKLLNQSEEIILDLRPHWWRIAPASAFLAVAVIIGLISLAYDWADPLKIIVGLGVLGALGYFVSMYVSWISDNFVVTTERVISRSGVFAKQRHRDPARSHQHGVLQPDGVRTDARCR